MPIKKRKIRTPVRKVEATGKRRMSVGSARRGINSYIRRAAVGDTEFRVYNDKKSDAVPERFMLIRCVRETDGVAIDVSVEFAKLNFARVCALVKSGVRFRVTSSRSGDAAMLVPWRRYRDPMQGLLTSYVEDQIDAEVARRKDEDFEQMAELLKKHQASVGAQMDDFSDLAAKYLKHVTRAALGYSVQAEALNGLPDDDDDDVEDQ